MEEMALLVGNFNQKYHLSPLRRTKRRGYLRNIAVALGNLHSPESIPPLTKALMHDPEPLVRSHAAWALGQIGSTLSRQTLEKAAGIEADSMVKLEIQAALANS
jgi:epoxyqueuosine reductase